MPTFKVGDKIRMKEYCDGNQKGEIYEVHEGNKNGFLTDILYAWNEKSQNSGCSCQGKWKLVEEPRSTEITKENLRVGDIIIEKDGYKEKVLEVLENTFLRSLWSNYSCAGCWITFEEAKMYGYKIYIEEPPKTRTVEDVLNSLSEEDKEIVNNAMK